MKHENSLLCVKTSITAALGFLTALWGWFGWLVVLWAALMLADWLVGCAAAARGGLWSSAKAREGAWHKAGMTVTVCVALAADWLAGTLLGNLPLVELPFTYSVLLGPLVIVWYVIGELGSLAEHAVTMGAPVPAWLPRLLAVTRNAVTGAAETITGDNPGRD